VVLALTAGLANSQSLTYVTQYSPSVGPQSIAVDGTHIYVAATNTASKLTAAGAEVWTRTKRDGRAA